MPSGGVGIRGGAKSLFHHIAKIFPRDRPGTHGTGHAASRWMSRSLRCRAKHAAPILAPRLVQLEGLRPDKSKSSEYGACHEAAANVFGFL